MSFAFLNFHFIPFISPSLLCFYNCGAVGSTRPTSPLLSSFGQKLYTRCLFSWRSLQGGDYCIIFQFSGHNSS